MIGMGYARYGTHSPTGSLCAKCGLPIENNMGRRFRLKWVHENCLPATRLKKILKRRGDKNVLVENGLVEQEKQRP